MGNGQDMTREEIASLLRFYAESGLDFPVCDDAVNRFDAIADVTANTPTADGAHKAVAGITDPHAPAPVEMDPRKRQIDAPQRPVVQAAPVTVPTQEVVAQAADLAARANTLDELKQIVETFDGCNLKRSARSTIFEGGRRSAKLMVVAAAPTRDDDVAGEALCGPEGLMLEKMFAAIGLSHREDIYIGYCVPWSPPGSAAPTPINLDMCTPFLARQVALAKPETVVLLGNVAMRQVFGTRKTIMQAHGQWTQLPDFGVEAMAIYDPAMLRAQPRLKRGAWLDLLALKKRLSGED